jgi:hypothetical protein
MIVDERFKNLEDLYRHTNASGSHFISYFPVPGLLHLSGTTPIIHGLVEMKRPNAKYKG